MFAGIEEYLFKVPGVSQYVEVSTAQPIRYAMSRKRAASSPLRLNEDEICSAYLYDAEEGERMYDICGSNLCDTCPEGVYDDGDEVEVISKQNENSTVENGVGYSFQGSIEETYRILEKKVDNMDEDYVEACKVIRSVEQPFFRDNR
uniref:Uncharacterized protein n=1 Tax=Parascaris equorum TaxID=6256 RepID=A0A914RK01_PAREQ